MTARRSRGWALVEATFALLVIVVLLAGAQVAGTAEARFAVESAERDAVRETAAEVLERARATPDELAPGEVRIGRVIRTVRELAPGLLEVTARASSGDAEATVTTLIAVETSR